MASRGTINNLTAKTVLEDMFKTGKPADAIIKEKRLGQVAAGADFDKILAQVVSANARPSRTTKPAKSLPSASWWDR